MKKASKKATKSTKDTKETKKKKKKKKSYYFDLTVQEKIIEYQNSDCLEKRHFLYEKFIFPAFNGLVQSLVAVYGFKSSNEDITHLKSDCITFLFESLHKWNPDKGTKAFSYFNVVAKNWLTIASRRLLRDRRRSAYIDDPDSMSYTEKSEFYEKEYTDSDYKLEKNREVFMKILEVVNFVEDQLKDKNDIKCCHAIRKVFNSIDDLEFFNKRAIFVYLREISGLNSTELSSSLSSIRKIYRKVVGPDKQFDIFG